MRRNFTRLKTVFEEELLSVPFDYQSAKVKFQRIEQVNEELKKLNERIRDLMIKEDVEAEDLDEEMIGAEQYEMQFLEMQNRLPEQASTKVSSLSGDHLLASSKRHVKLPKIELKRFNGDLGEWISWWSQFEKIHEDECLHPSDKFQYLIQATLPGSPARELVDNFPPSEKNYAKAVDALREHFGDEDLLVEFYVRELLDLGFSSSNVRDKGSLLSLVCKLESHLKSLESLDVSMSAHSHFLYPMIASSISEDI